MAHLNPIYREKEITIITSPTSATSQFEHAGKVYQQKAKYSIGHDKAVAVQLYQSACKQIDKVLGPLKAEHLLKT